MQQHENSLANRIRQIEREQEKEIRAIRGRYREIIQSLREGCEHEYGAEYLNNGEIPDTNLFGEWFFNRRCAKCGHVHRYLKSAQPHPEKQEETK